MPFTRHLRSTATRKEAMVRKDYRFGVLANEQRNRSASEIAARDEFNRQHPPIEGPAVAANLRDMEVSELEPGGWSTRHRHTTEAHLHIVEGNGFTLINDDDDPVERVDWSEGTLLSPSRWAWHQHFNLDTGDTARYLAIQDAPRLVAAGEASSIEQPSPAPVGR